MPWYHRVPGWLCVLVALATMVAAACIEHAMGRVLLCTCGHVRLWVGAVKSAENSQQVADWYSFSHVIHGFILYAVLRGVSRKRWPVMICLALAVAIEATWEVAENSPLVIQRYRQTASLDYAGDSILNSMSDILFCVIGFALAARLPVWVTIALTILMEVGVAIAIRDNLTLNIIMLLHPFEAIKRWQAGAG